MNSFGNMIGEICKVILPIPEKSFLGNNDSTIAICTLSSINLLKNIANSEIMKQISLAGRLFSENKGIDSIVKFVNQNQNIKTIIVCGKEVWGHKAGHSLIQLHKNGIDSNGKIIGSNSPEPFLTVTQIEVNYFQKKVKLVNMINETNLEIIKQKVI